MNFSSSSNKTPKKRVIELQNRAIELQNISYKTKWPEGYTLLHFAKIAKKVTSPKKQFFNVFRVIYRKRRFSVPVTSFWTFAIFSKKLVYRPLQSFCLLWNFVYLELFGGTSPRWCSRGSPGGWIEKNWKKLKYYFFTKIVDNYHWKIHWKK